MERVILDIENNVLNIGDEVIASRSSWTMRCWIYRIKEDKILLTRTNIQNNKIEPSYDGYTFLEHNSRLSSSEQEVYQACTVIKPIKDEEKFIPKKDVI